MENLNVPYYSRRAHAKKKALTAYLKKLMRKKPAGMYAITQEARTETWKKIDCTTCGNCCNTMTPTWKKAEVKKVAAHMGMTYDEYYEKYLYTDDSGDIMNDSTPCQHYDTTSRLCTIYELRPFDCSEFPHFHRKDFYDQVEDVFAPNMPRCPATLVWVEQIEALSQTKLNIK